MLSQDRILWMINVALTGLLNAAGLRTAKQYQEAMDVIQHSLEEFFGLDIGLINNMDDNSLLELLRQGEELDLERVVLAGDLFLEDGILHNELDQPEEAQADFQRTLFLYLEAAFSEESTSPVLAEKIDQVYALADVEGLPLETKLSLFYSFNRQASWKQAFDMIRILTAIPEIQDEMTEDGCAFYEQLLGFEDSQLEEQGLSRADIEDALRSVSGG